MLKSSVSDPFHFDADPDPDPDSDADPDPTLLNVMQGYNL